MAPSNLAHYHNAPMADRAINAGLIATLESPRRTPRNPPDFILDLSQSALSFQPPPTLTVHGSYLVRYQDALLFGPNNLVTPDGCWSCETRKNKNYIIPYMHEDFYKRIFPGPKPNVEFSGLPSRLYTSNLHSEDVEIIEEPVFLATPLEPPIWGRWVTTVLPKVLHYGLHAPTRRFLCHAAHPWQKDFLKIAGLPAEALLPHDPGRTFICRDVMTIEFSELDLCISLAERTNLLKIIHENKPDYPSPPKIYLSRLSRSRANPNYRVLENEAAFAAALEAIGFVTVDPELLTITQQLALFSKAEIVVSPGGSGIFNAAFCPPSARIVTIESSTKYIGVHAAMLASLGLRHGIIFGREDPSDLNTFHKRWTLDIKPAVQIIESFAAPDVINNRCRAPNHMPAPMKGFNMPESNSELMTDRVIQPPDDFYLADDHRDVGYARVLQSIHINLKPERYLEVGTLAGDTLALAECASLAIDPTFAVKRDVIGKKPFCMAFQMTSDEFFANYDPKVLLGGTIDFAFLDGLHWFEFLLRDFINVEMHARRNSIVLMHDCIPTDTYIARREVHDRGLAAYSPHLGWWAGDVWKTAAILLKYRPDLCIYGCKASPTGLLAITNLDPASTALRDNYLKLVDEYSSKPSSKDNLKDYVASLNFLEPQYFLSADLLASRFNI